MTNLRRFSSQTIACFLVRRYGIVLFRRFRQAEDTVRTYFPRISRDESVPDLNAQISHVHRQ